LKYFVYIIRSLRDGSYYIGYTRDLNRRLEEHNRGESRYTSRKIPWEVVYYEEYDSKREALKRERYLKRQRNRSYYERLIRGEM